MFLVMAHDGGFIEEGSFCASSSSSPLLPLLLLLLVFFCCFLDMVPSGGLVSKVGLWSLFALLLFRQTKRRNGFFFCEHVVLWCGKWRVLLFLRWILEMRKGRVGSRKSIHGGFEKCGLFLAFQTGVSWRGSSGQKEIENESGEKTDTMPYPRPRFEMKSSRMKNAL